MKKNIGVFLDRDGTISEEVGYVNHIDRYKLYPFTIPAIKFLNDNELKVVLVTNQSGIARGYFPEGLVKDIHKRLEGWIREGGGRLDGIYYCPHHPSRGCDCRKPDPGMVKRASEELNIDLESSYVVGDKGVDIEMAGRVGAKGILVMTGYGKGELKYNLDKFKKRPDYIAEDLYQAALWIVKDLSEKGLTIEN